MSRKRKIKIKKIIELFLFILLISVLIVLVYKNNNKSKKSKDSHNEPVIKEEVKSKKEMSLLMVGDVLIHESVYKDAKENNTYNFHKMFTLIEPTLKKYDLKFCNQESIIGGSALGISGYPAFNSPDEIGDELVNLGFNMVSLANNHALDKGRDAVLYSNSYWKSKNIIISGTNSSTEEANDIKAYERNGIKFAFLAYTEMSNSKPSNDYILNIYSKDKVKHDIEKIKDKVDVIIVSMHWGQEYSNTPTSSQIEIANYLSSLGVNLIIGSHPHVVQPITYINNTLVIYSLGNFISNQLSIGLNQGIGLMVGLNISLENNKVSFSNINKELILAYAENSTNFKVIPFSQLTDSLLNNYESINKKYLNIVNGG